MSATKILLFKNAKSRNQKILRISRRRYGSNARSRQFLKLSMLKKDAQKLMKKEIAVLRKAQKDAKK